ncbi:MAG: glycosyltransferase family 4 protein [Coleofasciculus sp. S288]|nr:glycosyltransferase family 4 protein [Coleofasciculus sp. S288]
MYIRPRVLFVLGVLWGDNGITSHLAMLAKGLIKQGWEVALASGLASGIDGANEQAIHAIQRIESEGVKHFFVPFPNLRLSPKNLTSAFQSLLRLDAIIRQFRPDIIHVHSLSVCPYVQVIQLLHRLPFISTCHLEPETDRLNVKFSTLAKQGFNTVFGNRVIAISSNLKDAFKRIMKVPEENIRLIYHGIENEYFRPPSFEERLKAREAFNLAPESKVVCHIGRLSLVKGHDVLIRAISILRSQGIDAIALCAGKGYGDEEDVIRLHAAQGGVSDLVHLLGFADTRQVLWASDVITLPSRREGFPLVIAEAMLCGVVPVRTPAAGAFDQIEDGVNGFIVPFDAPEALALLLKQLLQNNELRAQMSASAIESARQKFTADRMIKDTIALYEEVIDEENHLRQSKVFNWGESTVADSNVTKY